MIKLGLGIDDGDDSEGLGDDVSHSPLEEIKWAAGGHPGYGNYIAWGSDLLLLSLISAASLL
jgi:hypothetical protein